MMWKGEVAAQVKWNGQALCAARLPACLQRPKLMPLFCHKGGSKVAAEAREQS